MRRRDFLKGIAIVPASAAAAQWSTVAKRSCGWVKDLRISAVVYDERYADCRLFADVLAQQGAVRFPSAGDAVSVWYGALREHIAQRGGRVGGMTTDSDLTVSRMCGREEGLKLIYEGSHDCRTSNRLVHRLVGNGVEREVYAALLGDKTPWPHAIADALSRPLLAARFMNPAAGRPVITRPHSIAHPGYLASWLLGSDWQGPLF